MDLEDEVATKAEEAELVHFNQVEDSIRMVEIRVSYCACMPLRPSFFLRIQ